MNKGFLLLAHRKPKYAQMAFNLAMSMRYHGCTLPIALVTDQEPLSFNGKPFSEIIQKEPQDLIPFYCKTKLNQLSPFDRTIFLDVDALCLRNPDELFDIDKDFAIQVTRRDFMGIDKAAWADPEAVFQHYKIPAGRPWTETNSSLILFGKNKQTEDIFTLAEAAYACDPFPNWKGTVGFYPDELAFNTALAILNIRPPDIGKPIYFPHPKAGIPVPKTFPKEAYFMGLYGNAETVHFHAWRIYNKIMAEECRSLYGHHSYMIWPGDKAQSDRGVFKRWTAIRHRDEFLQKISDICQTRS